MNTERHCATEFVLSPGQTCPEHYDPAGHAPLGPGRPGGVIVSEFSTASRDELDVFTDPDVRRATVVRG